MHRKLWRNWLRSMLRLEMNQEKKEVIEESEAIGKEVQRAIEAGQTVIKTHARKTLKTRRSISVNMTGSYDQLPAKQYQLNESHRNHDDENRFLKLLKVGGAVASWLVRSSPERVVRVRALAGDIVLCSWARHSTLTEPLSTQVYKWVPANSMQGVTLRWTSIPSRGM